MMMINFFVGWLTYKQLAVVFLEETIVRKPQDRDCATHCGGNRSWIAETAVRSGTTTPRRHGPSSKIIFFICFAR